MNKPPRTALRKIVANEEPNKTLASKVDLLLYADYLIFMRRLSEEASRLAASQGDRRVTEEHIDAVADVSGRQPRGRARRERRLRRPTDHPTWQRVLREFRG